MLAVRYQAFRISSVADLFSKQTRSRIMSAIRKRGNRTTELRLVMLFREHRITGWRRHRPVPGRPDFVFPKLRIAVFVDGCFWHRCRWHCRLPSSNRGYWRPKLARNRRRDRLNSAMLRKSGWVVVRLWEHQLTNPVAVAVRVRRALAQGRERLSSCDSQPYYPQSVSQKPLRRRRAQTKGARGSSESFAPQLR